MDFYLDQLLNLPNVTVSSCQQQEGLIFLTLDFLTERLEGIKLGKKCTKRYEEYLYERVRELTVEQVAINENLSPEQVQKIFSQPAQLKKKTGECLKD